MGEAVFAAKEINRLIGGIDMLDAESQRNRGEEGKARSFRDIAILYRTHYQARLLEKTLSQEGNSLCGKRAGGLSGSSPGAGNAGASFCPWYIRRTRRTKRRR